MASENTILFVDDDDDIRMLATLALQEVGGFRVEAFSSGADGVAALAQVRPDLMVCDVMMPGMDGPETLRAVRNQPGYGELPCIFMTAKAMPAEVEALMAAGALGVITKPFDPMTLADQVRTILRGRDG